jgi:monoamine oxidase
LKLIPFQPDRPPQSPNGKRLLEPAEQARGALGNALWADDSLIDFLEQSGVESLVQRYDKIDGGNDRLPAAFAARLENRIRYGSPVVGIQQDEHGVRAVVQHEGDREVVDGDFLICAVPFTVLRDINVSPAFRPAKRSAIEQLNYAAASRIFLQSATRYWTKSGKSGFEVTEDMAFFDATFGQPGDRGIMMLYALGDPALRIEHLMPDQRIGYGRDVTEQIYPGMSTNFERGFAWCWDEVPWARGAFAVYKPDQWSTLQPVAMQPEGRIHFAGEHLSSWPGWMQGALASGLRAAREVSARA